MFDGIIALAFLVSGAVTLFLAIKYHGADSKPPSIAFWQEIFIFSGAIGSFRLFFQFFPNVSPDAIFLVLTIAATTAYLGYVIFGKTETATKNKKLFRDIALCLLAVFIFRGFFFDYFYIPSKSMVPTLQVGDLVLIDKNAYGYRVPVFNNYISHGTPPARGDIVVFRQPQQDIYYIKRIVAVAGDEVKYDSYKRLFVNGKMVERESTDQLINNIPLYREKSGGTNGTTNGDTAGWFNVLIDSTSANLLYQAPDSQSCSLQHEFAGSSLTCRVPTDAYFVLGDNRDHSNDSRYWGFVPKENLVGPAQVVMFNLGGLSHFVSRFWLSLKLQ